MSDEEYDLICWQAVDFWDKEREAFMLRQGYRYESGDWVLDQNLGRW
jgi:hypothetical protein